MRRWVTPDGGVLAEAGYDGFHWIDGRGEIRDFAPRIDSVDDSLYTTVFAVVDDALVQRLAVETDALSRSEDRVELEGLRELAPGEAPTEADVRAAIAERDARLNEEEDTARIRINALARSPTNALPALDAARKALAERVVRRSDDLSQDMLRCLTELAELHEDVSGDLDAAAHLGTAADELSGAARLIAFCATAADLSLTPYPPAFAPTPSTPKGPLLAGLVEPRARLAHTVHAELLDRMEELQSEVVIRADLQAQFRARVNQLAYLRAATRIARAAPHVATACLLAAGLD